MTKNKLTLGDIVSFTGAVLTGDPGTEINNPAKIESAGQGEISFLTGGVYMKYFEGTKASALFVKEGFEKTRSDIAYLEVKDPFKSFLQMLVRFFSPEFPLKGISASAYIDPGSQIGKNCAIGENVVIEAGCTIGNNVKIYHNTVILRDTVIGDNALIFQNVSIRENTIIGNNVIIHPGAVIGGDGFGFLPDANGVYFKIPQVGNVVIEDDVEIGANTAIDRAAMGSTVIQKGVKLDNFVQVAHGAIVGAHSVMSAQSGIAGSTKLGNHCVVAAQVGIADHLEITNKVIIAAQSGVSKSLTKPGMYFGYPAKDHRTALRLEGHFRALPDYADRIKSLEKKIAELEAKLSENSKG